MQFIPNKNNKMKKIQVICISLFLLALAAGLNAQTVDEIIEKYADASGGRTAVTAVLTMKAIGSMSMMGMDFPFTMYSSFPDKSYLEVNIQGMIMKQGCDGVTGWTINPMMGSSDPEKIDEDLLKSFKQRGRTYSVLFTYKEDGAKAELIGKESLNGKDVYKIKYTGPDNDEQYYYIDDATGNLLRVDKKVTVMGKKIDSQTTYENYKKIDELTIPFLMEVKTSESKMGNQTMILDKVEINPLIEESIYSMPVK